MTIPEAVSLVLQASIMGGGFTGLRPGEKLFEEILTAEEGTDASQHEKRKTAESEEQRAKSRERRAER